MKDEVIFENKTLVCVDCEKEFIFKAEEQEHFSKKEYPAPIRCPMCRLLKKERIWRKYNG